MKRYILSMIFICVQHVSKSQETTCPPNFIQTNPANPINNIHPFYSNYFDWTSFQYPANWGNINQMTNPNWVNNGDASNLYGEEDYFPEDGWELVYVDLGLDRFGDPLPQGLRSGQMWFMLYNKYRSIVRLFVAIDQLDPNNLVEIELRIPNGDYNTGIFALMDKVKKPLKEFNPTIRATGVKKFINGTDSDKHWHYADFPVNYDPCTCEKIPSSNALSKLMVSVNLITNASIDLEGSSSGSINMANKPNSSSNGTTAWDNFYGVVKKVDGVLAAGNKAYKSYGLFQQDVKTTATGKEKEQKMKSGIDNLALVLTKAAPFLNTVPYAGEALAIIDFFVSGSKKENDGTIIPPLAMQLEHSFSGNIYTVFPYIETQFYTPGSDFSIISNPNIPHGDVRYPVYNEILGVYTILDRPKIEVWKGWARFFLDPTDPLNLDLSIQNSRRALIIDKESIEIALNPESGLILKEAYVQATYQIQAGKWNSTFSGSVLNDSVWVSDLMPMSCLDDNLIIADIDVRGVTGQNTNDKIDLGIILVLENADGEIFLHKAVWHSDVTINMYPYDYDYDGIWQHDKYYEWFSKPEFIGLDTGFYNATENLYFLNDNVTTNERVTESIVIENSTVISAYQHSATLTAGESITVLPESAIRPNSRLAIYRPGLECERTFDLADAEYITNICSSWEYQYTKGAAKMELVLEETASFTQLQISVYPNPTTNYVQVSVKNQPQGVANLQFVLFDITGRQVMQTEQEANSQGQYTLQLPQLSGGIYMLHIKAGQQTSVEKVVIK